ADYQREHILATLQTLHGLPGGENGPGEHTDVQRALVKKDFVLTAAHCSCIAGNITVILGAHNVHEPEETQQLLRVRRIIPHPEFTRDPFTNDLLLLQ
ncbi:unnamed protein product, partial [Caretta caretta]